MPAMDMKSRRHSPVGLVSSDCSHCAAVPLLLLTGLARLTATLMIACPRLDIGPVTGRRLQLNRLGHSGSRVMRSRPKADIGAGQGIGPVYRGREGQLPTHSGHHAQGTPSMSRPEAFTPA